MTTTHQGSPPSGVSRPGGPRARNVARLVVVLVEAVLLTLTALALATGRPWGALTCGTLLVLGAGAAIAVEWQSRRLVVVTVCGSSMDPAYRDGERVLVRREPAHSVGQVIVVERAEGGTGRPNPPLPPGAGPELLHGRQWMIKRVAAVPGDPLPRERFPALAHVSEDRVPQGRLVLLGDNHRVSYDSRRMGYFPCERVLGTVVRKLPPTSAIGRKP